MTLYKIIFTVTQAMFILSALGAMLFDERKAERTDSFRVIAYFVIISSIGCTIGMWL